MSERPNPIITWLLGIFSVVASAFICGYYFGKQQSIECSETDVLTDTTDLPESK